MAKIFNDLRRRFFKKVLKLEIFSVKGVDLEAIGGLPVQLWLLFKKSL